MTSSRTEPNSFSPDKLLIGLWLVLTGIPIPVALYVLATRGLSPDVAELLVASIIGPIAVLVFVSRFRVSFTPDEFIYRSWGPTIRVRYEEVVGIEITKVTPISGQPVSAVIRTRDGKRLPFWPKLFPRRAVTSFLRMAPRSARCGICGRQLDVADDPLSVDCAGDCWGCVSEIEVEGTGVDLDEYRRDPAKFKLVPALDGLRDVRPLAARRQAWTGTAIIVASTGMFFWWGFRFRLFGHRIAFDLAEFGSMAWLALGTFGAGYVAGGWRSGLKSAGGFLLLIVVAIGIGVVLGNYR